MNQKVLAFLSIVAIILGVFNLVHIIDPNLINLSFLQFTPSNTSQQIALQVVRITIQNASDGVFYHYRVQVTIMKPEGTPTLYNCHIQLDYLTKSNVWSAVSEDIGIVNYSGNGGGIIEFGGDFKSGKSCPASGSSYSADQEPNIRVSSYGYLKP